MGALFIEMRAKNARSQLEGKILFALLRNSLASKSNNAMLISTSTLYAMHARYALFFSMQSTKMHIIKTHPSHPGISRNSISSPPKNLPLTPLSLSPFHTRLSATPFQYSTSLSPNSIRSIRSHTLDSSLASDSEFL